MEDIERYLSKQMGFEERVAFEEALHKDPNLNEAFELSRKTYGLVWLMGEEREKKELLELGRNLMDEKVPAIKARFNYLKIILPIAVGIVALLILVINLNYQRDPAKKLFVNYFDSQAIDLKFSLSQRGTLEKDSLLLVAEEAYLSEDYIITAQILDNLQFKYPNNGAYAYYGGISYLQIQEFDLAIASLKKGIYDPNYQQRSEWYLLLAYLGNENIDEAIKFADTILINQNHYRYEEVLQIKNGLSN